MDDTITISSAGSTDDILDYSGPFTVDVSALDSTVYNYNGMNYVSTAGYNYNNITISNGGSSLGNYSINSNPWGPTSASTTMGGKLEVEGENADVIINGKSLAGFMDKMEKRLAILSPDPAKLEHFEALKKAHENYKTLEALCELPKEEDDGNI